MATLRAGNGVARSQARILLANLVRGRVVQCRNRGKEPSHEQEEARGWPGFETGRACTRIRQTWVAQVVDRPCATPADQVRDRRTTVPRSSTNATTEDWSAVEWPGRRAGSAALPPQPSSVTATVSNMLPAPSSRPSAAGGSGIRCALGRAGVVDECHPKAVSCLAMLTHDCRPALLRILSLAAASGPAAFTRRLRVWQPGAL